MLENLKKYSEALSTQWKRLSSRERGLIGGVLAIFLAFGIYLAADSVMTSFEEQDLELQMATRSLQETSVATARFQKLEARRRAIEKAFQAIEIQEDVLSYLEDRARNKIGGMSGLTIKDKTVTKLGKNYEQVPYSIKFNTADLSSLIDFLKELAFGDRPLILTRIFLEKITSNNRLNVELDVSSIRRVKA